MKPMRDSILNLVNLKRWSLGLIALTSIVATSHAQDFTFRGDVHQLSPTRGLAEEGYGDIPVMSANGTLIDGNIRIRTREYRWFYHLSGVRQLQQTYYWVHFSDGVTDLEGRVLILPRTQGKALFILVLDGDPRVWYSYVTIMT